MSKEQEFKLLSKEEIEKNRIKAYKYIDMSKEKTLTDYLESKGILVRLGNTMLVTECIDIIDELLTKEKEQREELIKKAFTDGAEWELYGSDLTQEERAEQYYNEVIKPKHLNK